MLFRSGKQDTQIEQIVECIKITKDFIKKQSKTEIDFGNWQVGNYAWKLRIIKKLTGCSKVSGKQGLWNIELEQTNDI